MAGDFWRHKLWFDEAKSNGIICYLNYCLKLLQSICSSLNSVDVKIIASCQLFTISTFCLNRICIFEMKARFKDDYQYFVLFIEVYADLFNQSCLNQITTVGSRAVVFVMRVLYLVDWTSDRYVIRMRTFYISVGFSKTDQIRTLNVSLDRYSPGKKL